MDTKTNEGKVQSLVFLEGTHSCTCKTGSYFEELIRFLICYILWNGAKKIILTLHNSCVERKLTKLTYTYSYCLTSVSEEEAILLLSPTSVYKSLYFASFVISLYKLWPTFQYLQFFLLSSLPLYRHTQVSV